MGEHEAPGLRRLHVLYGRRYEGDWKDNRQDGRGAQTWPRGDSYDGEWENDTRTGYGSYVWAEGDRYIGGWKNGLRHYFGRYEWPDGRKYEGMWAENNRNGEGTYVWPDGAYYTGTWVDNKRHGQGTMIWRDGLTYTGRWHMEDRVDDPTIREGQPFFTKTSPGRRQAFSLKDYMQRNPEPVKTRSPLVSSNNSLSIPRTRGAGSLPATPAVLRVVV